jgi:hypothetical protein
MGAMTGESQLAAAAVAKLVRHPLHILVCTDITRLRPSPTMHHTQLFVPMRTCGSFEPPAGQDMPIALTSEPSTRVLPALGNTVQVDSVMGPPFPWLQHGSGVCWVCVCRDADAGQVALLLAAAQLGADTFEAFVNSPPYFWTISKSSRWGQNAAPVPLVSSRLQLSCTC